MASIEAVPEVWDRYGVGDLFQREEHRSGGHWSAAFLESEVRAGDQQLWLVLREGREIIAALVTDIRPYPNGFRTCMITAAVGRDPRDWIGLQNELGDWARRSGCEKMETIGRWGWKPLLKEWRAAAVYYERDL